jgi:hypothetical protein
VPPGPEPGGPGPAGRRMHSGWHAGEALKRVARLHMAVGDADGTMPMGGLIVELCVGEVRDSNCGRLPIIFRVTVAAMLLVAARESAASSFTLEYSTCHNTDAGSKPRPWRWRENRAKGSQRIAQLKVLATAALQLRHVQDRRNEKRATDRRLPHSRGLYAFTP